MFRYLQHEHHLLSLNDVCGQKTTVRQKHTWKDQILGHTCGLVIRISQREGHAMYSNLFRVRRTRLEVHGQKGR